MPLCNVLFYPVRVKELHRPARLWRRETAEHEYLCILWQEGLQGVLFTLHRAVAFRSGAGAFVGCRRALPGAGRGRRGPLRG